VIRLRTVFLVPNDSRVLANGEACWGLGEEDIAYWHATDEGFDNRKPLPSV